MAKLRKTIPIKQLEVPDSSLVAEDIINNFSTDPNESTGLRTVIVFDEISIKRGRIRTSYEKFDITPTGRRT